MAYEAIVERICSAYRSGWVVTRDSLTSTAGRFSTLDEARRDARKASAGTSTTRLVINVKAQSVAAVFVNGEEA